jgi:PAS domain S-box-containing protein
MGSGAARERTWHAELALRVVEALAVPGDPTETIQRLLACVREQTGLAAAAIRLRDGADFPYHVSEGLSEEHLRRERSVLAEDAALDPCKPPLVCLCGRVLRGETDPALGCFSASGSFLTPSLQTVKGTLRGIRGGCVREGFETHALIPLRDGGETIGLLQLSDPRAGALGAEDLTFLERLGASVGIALSRRRGEMALRQSRELFETAFRSAPVLMALSRIQDGRYLEVNDRFCEASGVTREEALGKTSVELGWLSAGDRARMLERLLRDGRVRDVEMRRAGRVAAIHGELVTVGEERLLLSIGQDLTDEQRAREALRESETRFRELAELLPVAVFEAGRDGRITYANQAAHSLFGHTPEELAAGLHAAAMIDPSDRERALRAFTEVMERSLGTGNAYLGLRRDGESFPIRIYSGPIVREGEVRGIRGVIVDETATRRGEEERERLQTQLMHAQRMESIGTLAGGIAHDFNNLLGGILGSLSLMEEELGEGFAFRDDLVEMKGLVARGADLTRQLLGFARRAKPDPKPLDLNLVVEKTARLYGRTRKDVVLRLEREPQLPTVLADRTQLEQVLLNLMLNAGQAMPEGGVLLVRTSTLELTSTEAESQRVAPGRFVRMDLADSGEGMAPETVAHIFEPFFTTREGKGSGLGLASVLGIVTGHGGFITVESQLGAGATFSVHLPASEEPLLQENPSAGPPRRGGETVLVIDDEEPVLRVTGRLLERLGHRVLKARSGLEALEILRRGSDRIGLVILDMIMPGMNGRQTFDALRELAPELKVLIASGHSEEGQAADLLARGCLGFIQKPFDVTRLAAKLAEIL